MKNIFRKLIAITTAVGGLFAQQASALTDHRFTSTTNSSWSNGASWTTNPGPVSEEGGTPDEWISIEKPAVFDVSSTFI